MQTINKIWQEKIKEVLTKGKISSPRELKIKELLGSQIKINMKDPIVTITDRKMNYCFAFGEAYWITSGSNKVADITQYLSNYNKYSDDGFVLSGAYGPKFVDQIRYVTDTLYDDKDSRQAVINIWRENPRPSKDIPCTLSIQFFIRKKYDIDHLHAIVNMRSQDLVWGFCYDSFTFSMMSKTIQTLLAARGVQVELGDLTINQGSLHIYEEFWDKADAWASSLEVDDFIWNDPKFSTYEAQLQFLKKMADERKRS